ncbi:MAG: Ig-like domain-containing protein [Leptospiraceae bacterium]|nr:Ig-like domain-containing protein [Leptospiraceae bacterium]
MKNFRKTILFLILINCNYFEDAKGEENLFLKFLGVGQTVSNTTLAITLTHPKDLSRDNYLNTNIFVTFNKNITRFNSSNFKITLEDKTNVEGRIEMNENVLSFYPSKNLSPNTTYIISLKAGNGLAKDTQSLFTTGSTVDNIHQH